MTVAFVCSQGCAYTEEEIDLGMRLVDMDAQMERERHAWDLEEDRDHEEALGRAWLSGDEECPWPWYAEKPYAICRPEVIEP